MDKKNVLPNDWLAISFLHRTQDSFEAFVFYLTIDYRQFHETRYYISENNLFSNMKKRLHNVFSLYSVFGMNYLCTGECSNAVFLLTSSRHTVTSSLMKSTFLEPQQCKTKSQPHIITQATNSNVNSKCFTVVWMQKQSVRFIFYSAAKSIKSKASHCDDEYVSPPGG